jgi:predicted PurR-regulated permease PerM
MKTFEDNTFLWLLVAVSIAFAWILVPLSGAILWAGVLAILFAPVQRRLVRSMRGRKSLAALANLAIIVVMVILPLALITAQLIQEASELVAKVRSGEINLPEYYRRIVGALPAWAAGLVERFGVGDAAALQEKVSEGGLMKGSQVVGGFALGIGQNTLDFVVSLFVMLYLLFFLLRDGDALVARIRRAVPLRPEQQGELLTRFAVVIRATVKGNVAVAALQGALGGLIFWILGIPSPLLWGVLMAILSLLPAVGAALVWGPVAIYFLLTGALWQGIVLIAFGVLVIGLVDNVLRPVLVGKDTRMPDYIVLVSTLGGIAIFGVNGFIIGPVIAAMFMACWDLFSDLRRTAETDAEPPKARSGRK